MRLTTRWGAAAVATLTGLVLSAGAALAAPPPSNDLGSGATVIAALPYTASLDTSGATTDADDVQANTNCGAPATAASVWYSYTATADGFLVADVSASSYSAGVIVGEGSPGALTFISCGPGGTGFPVTAGHTYTILAFDDQTDGSGNGGTLEITVDVAPPPPTIEAAVNPVAQFDSQSGGAYVSGTVTCDEGADFAYVDLQLTQRVGRLLIRGYGSAEVSCTGQTEPWSTLVFGDNGLFKGGKAVNASVAVACNISGCGEYYSEQSIQLKGKKG
jgi:hypothetical protein